MMNFETLNAAKLRETPDITGRTWHGDPPKIDDCATLTYCEICGKPIDDDDDSVTDTDGMGYVHDKCLSEWRDDAEYRAADNAFDLAGDR